ncbi:unnamed protein product [Haemonchus placei]|uniref:Kunitz/Bovine pancreatic trypsin inhibitor domain protein n=1 Tax=Haemonchus placei TaxID=6290 RepID=A0A0N4VS77_HAEPC|nr:unnamed protein product [Haemonchus placei]
MLRQKLGIFLFSGSPSSRWCTVGDFCDNCTIQTAISANCNGTSDAKRHLFLFCNPRTKLIDVDSSSYLTCTEGVYRQNRCSDNGRTHFSATAMECTDPATMTFHAQGTSGSGRVGDVCSFNTDCLSGMYCAIGQCRCLSTYIAVDAYCYERISPSESGCFYDVQCSAVWPDAYCKNGQCHCPSLDMVAVKTRDGTLCIWSSSTEPSCPLPSLPPPDSAAALVVLPAPSAKNSVSIATCNPRASAIPSTEEILLSNAHDYKCAVRGTIEDSAPKDVSDLYDCIDNSKFWQGQGLNTNLHPIGVCCMNRAFTCQQPKKGESDELGAVPRWWFNGIIGSCQQFLFDPTSSEVSPNNFETLDHCESFCKDTCPRGNPAYVPMRTDLGQIPQGGCTISHPCPDPYECVDVASQSLCCPSRKSICSEMGGRVKNPLRNTPYDAGMRFDQLTGEQANYAVGISTRYYYNPIDGQCHPFTYNGFLGNFNNFHTQADCQLFCARLQCVHGNPLTTGHGVPQRCQRDIDCPSTHTCTTEHGVCCPTPRKRLSPIMYRLIQLYFSETLCTEPLRVGDCKQSVRQFWYNAETKTCEGFLYTGCQGNNNRFHTLNECQSYCKNINAEPKCPQGRAYIDYSGKFLQCGDGLGGNACPANYECHFDGLIHGCCPSKAFTCSLQVSKGVACGSGSSYRYYYNNQLKECQSFLFLGCDGNSNNFPSAEKCQSYCEIAVCPNGGSPLRSNQKVRSCSTNDPCPAGYECSQVDTNGVTQRRCCPTKSSICSKPPQMGMLPKCSSGSGQTRYYFNVALQTCSPYTSNGCDTSLNSFKTLAECEDFCLSAGCQAGDTVYKVSTLSYCRISRKRKRSISEYLHRDGVCPNGEKAFVEPITLTPRQCAMVADRKCPAGYLCRFSQNNHKYYCCGSISGSLCPAGRALFRYPTTQLPLQCHITHGGGGCPPSYACQSDVPGAFQGYCCSQHPICPGGVNYHLDEKTQMPTTCSSEGFAFCPQVDFLKNISDGCPPGQYAYITSGQVKSCDPFNVDGHCPSEYTCQWSVTNQKYQCCGTRPIRQTKPNKIDDGCLRKQFALLDRRTSKPRICTAGEENSCPIGFFCQFSAKRSQFQCCGQSGGCPERRAAYIAVDGNAQECLPGPDMCADGFECVRSVDGSGKNICCSKEDNECSENEKMINGTCVVHMRIGGPCHRDEECGGGSTCESNICRCPSGQNAVLGECVSTECNPNQIILEGRCVDRAASGESCKSSFQCISNLRCLNNKCDCGKGERIDGNNCVKIDEDERAFFEKGTTRLRYCSQIADDCPTGYSCQYSNLVGVTFIQEAALTQCLLIPAHCPSGMTPYLLNGQPKLCSSSTCPYGFQCRFSPSKKNYFCCSKILKKSNHLRKDGGCERGSVLLYPSTQEPVQCDQKTRACPSGYLCLPHTTTKCPKYMVRVVGNRNGRRATYCGKDLKMRPHFLNSSFCVLNGHTLEVYLNN